MEKKYTKLLELRKKIKSKKPHFIRQQYNKKKSLGKKWHAPKGMHSKMRLSKRGKLKKPSLGFSSPKKVKFLTAQGFKPKLVNNLFDINSVKNDEIIILSSKLGIKKKIQILEKIKELKLNVLNIKNIDEFITKVKEQLKQRKEEAKKKDQKKKEEKAKITKKVEEKKEEKTEEEKTKEEDKEKKELTKKLIEGTDKKPQKLAQTQLSKQQISRASAPKQK